MVALLAVLGGGLLAAVSVAAAASTTTCSTSASSYKSLITGTAGLAGYWRVDEKNGSTACDTTGHDNGAYHGTVTLGADGAISGDSDTAIRLVGTGYVSVPSAGALNPASALTVEAWVRPSTVSISQTVVRKDGQYLVRLSGDKLLFRIWSGGSYVEAVSPSVLQAGSWQHVVGTYDGSTVRVYRNGVQVASRSLSGAVATTRNPLYIGQSAGYDRYSGSLDEVTLYSTALTSSQVQSHYSAVASGSAVSSGTATTTSPRGSTSDSGGTTTTSGGSPTSTTSDTPASLTPSVTCGLGTFAVGAWPSSCWRPYADSSPFNQVIPTNPGVDPNSTGMVQRLVSWFGSYGYGGPTDIPVGAGHDWNHPTYWPSSSDPVFTVHCTESWGTCDVEGAQVHIPDAAQPANSGDAHMTVVDQSSGWEYDFWGVTSKPQGGGTISIKWGGKTRIDGDGLTGNATGANTGLLGGIVRAQEMQAGQINHALFVVAACDSGKIVYPASGHGSACSDPTNAPAEGTRFQLNMSDAEIDALSAPAWKKTLLRAMAHYGMYVGDTGGAPLDIQPEGAETYTSFGREDQWVTFAKQVGIPMDSSGRYVFHLGSVVDWSRLRVIDPCVAQRTC